VVERESWPPSYLAFYPTKVFGEETHIVRYIAKVNGIVRVPRYQLFPNEPSGKKAGAIIFRYSSMRWKPYPDRSLAGALVESHSSLAV
jgi:hypothetical protein